MRALPAVAVVIALAISGCATTAQGAVQAPVAPASNSPAPVEIGAQPDPAQPSAVPASAHPQSTPASPAASAASTLPAARSAASPGATQSPRPPAPTQSAVLLPVTGSRRASATPLPPNPYELGGPAPVGSFVLGDSISLSAGVGPVLARLGYPVMGLVGQSISDAYLRTHLSSPLAQQAPAWVLELGTNNQAGLADVARLAGWIALVDSLRSSSARQEVFWVTPHRPPFYGGGRTTWDLANFNAELRRIDERTPWLHVIDFDVVAQGHPEWFAADALHVHPDRAGQDVLVALIAGPDAVPAKIPAPLLNALLSRSPQPETFDNATVQPSAELPSSSVSTDVQPSVIEAPASPAASTAPVAPPVTASPAPAAASG